MKPNQWVISDTHFGHANICKFTNKDGSPLRPWDDVQEMDEEMVRRWNSVVGQYDRVYHLGDVVINRKALPILNRLNGKKVLIMGNHDIFPASEYLQYFEDVRAYKVGNGFIMSHIPISIESKGRYELNIHGHTHSNTLADPFYKCVCVEQINYTPVRLCDILNAKCK